VADLTPTGVTVRARREDAVAELPEHARRARLTIHYAYLFNRSGDGGPCPQVALSLATGVDWIAVQPGRYRHLTAVNEAIAVRLVISEYVTCEKVW
jgi:hypothetical protein